jgi:predicted transglutaminase-like cysteine proteinase
MILAAIAALVPADLAAVQLSVQINGTYRLDQRHAWAPLSEKGWIGDCKDFALEKRKELLARGYGPSRLVVWLAREGALHAVLVVDRRWVLDSQIDAVEPIGRQHADLVCPARDLSMFIGNDNDYGRCR